MGKGRAPCCDKTKVKRGPWSPAEDLKLIAFIQKYGHENWRALPKQAGLMRCGKSCRLRWINYLRPDVKRGNFTIEEEEAIIRLHKDFGNKWSKIASCLPGRTDNEIKNVWNTHLKKRLTIKNSVSSADESKLESSITSSSSSSISESFVSNETPNLEKVTPTNEFNEQASQVIMIEKNEQVCNELMSIIEDPKQSSNSFSSVESDILNTSQIVAFKPEQQLGSYDVDFALEEVDKPNHLFEIPWESDDDFWKFIDNFGSLQSNEVQSGEGPASQTQDFVEESVQDAEAMKWSHDIGNEFGVVGETNESNKDDQFLPKNYAADELGWDPHTFDLDANVMTTRQLDLGSFQLWSSWP